MTRDTASSSSGEGGRIEKRESSFMPIAAGHSMSAPAVGQWRMELPPPPLCGRLFGEPLVERSPLVRYSSDEGINGDKRRDCEDCRESRHAVKSFTAQFSQQPGIVAQGYLGRGRGP